MISEKSASGVSATRTEKFSRSVTITVISRSCAPICSGSAPATMRSMTCGDR